MDYEKLVWINWKGGYLRTRQSVRGKKKVDERKSNKDRVGNKRKEGKKNKRQNGIKRSMYIDMWESRNEKKKCIQVQE